MTTSRVPSDKDFGVGVSVVGGSYEGQHGIIEGYTHQAPQQYVVRIKQGADAGHLKYISPENLRFYDKPASETHIREVLGIEAKIQATGLLADLGDHVIAITPDKNVGWVASVAVSGDSVEDAGGKLVEVIKRMGLAMERRGSK